MDQSPLGSPIAEDSIPEHLRCTECGRECVGPPIRTAGVDRICTRCFREMRYRITMAEASSTPWRK